MQPGSSHDVWRQHQQSSAGRPAVPDAVIFTAEYDLSPTGGLHDIYLFVDALGVVNALGNHKDLGLNYESAEGNNSIWVGSLIGYKSFVFLPLIRRE